MKTITTKIPNKHKKQEYTLMHIGTFMAIREYLDELPKWLEDNDGDPSDWVHEVNNELEGVRRI